MFRVRYMGHIYATANLHKKTQTAFDFLKNLESCLAVMPLWIFSAICSIAIYANTAP